MGGQSPGACIEATLPEILESLEIRGGGWGVSRRSHINQLSLG